jgi:hypothetical protein
MPDRKQKTGTEENPQNYTASERSHQQPKEPKPLPIYIYGVTNYRAMTDNLATVTAK